MAENKINNSSSSSSDSSDPFAVLAVLSIITVIGGALFERFFSYLRSGEPFWEALNSLNNFIIPISYFISGLFLLGVIYSTWKLSKLGMELKLKFHSAGKKVSDTPTSDRLITARWQKILNKLESSDTKDWKLSILEADTILDELVDKMGYKGISLGEKLKNIEQSDFNTIDKAKQAHKIRNAVAHEKADFLITQSEARRVVGLYREVFEEFKYI